MRELEGRVERPDSSPGGGVVWYAYCSCMSQVSVGGVARAPLSVSRLLASAAARLRPGFLRRVPRVGPLRVRGCRVRSPVADFAAGFARCALRAFFHALRATAACLRARLASRLASFTRLRARLSSSLAMRTRCRATSACSRARSSGSAGSPAADVVARAPAAEAFAPSRAPGGGVLVDRFSLAVFPMRNRGQMAKGRAVSHNGSGLATRDLSTDFVNNPVYTAAQCGQSRCRSKDL